MVRTDLAPTKQANIDKLKVLCKRQKTGQDSDKNLLIQILCNRMLPTKYSDSSARADVIVKKILRTVRNFFDKKLDRMVQYKAKRNKNSLCFYEYTDYMVKESFEKEMMKLFGFTSYESISNCLAALIQPKSLKSKIEQIMTDIELL